jgi:hypothetical protein
MYSGKKILNICNIEEDTSAELLKIYPLSLNVFPEEVENKMTLEKMVDFFSNEGIINKELLKDILKDYLLETIANKYQYLLSGNHNDK